VEIEDAKRIRPGLIASGVTDDDILIVQPCRLARQLVLGVVNGRNGIPKTLDKFWHSLAQGNGAVNQLEGIEVNVI
jgi:hypothetical protein